MGKTKRELMLYSRAREKYDVCAERAEVGSEEDGWNTSQDNRRDCRCDSDDADGEFIEKMKG